MPCYRIVTGVDNAVVAFLQGLHNTRVIVTGIACQNVFNIDVYLCDTWV